MWVLLPEILPAKGVSIAVAIDWIGTLAMSLGYKSLSTLVGGDANVFYIFAASCVVVLAGRT